MKRFLSLILFSCFLTSCNKANKPEGMWIYSHEYYYDSDSTRRRTSSPEFRLFILEFEGSEMLEHIVLQPGFGQHKNPQRYEIKSKEEDLIIDENVSIKKVMPDVDSLVMTIINQNVTRDLVFDRLPASLSPNNWTPAENLYQIRAKNSTIKQIEFINDSLWIADTGNNFSINSWSIEPYQNLTFLVLDFAVGSYPLLIDSLSSKSSYFTLFDTQNQMIEFHEKPIPSSKRSKLLGHWELVDRKLADSSATRGIPRFDILRIHFMQDSLEYELEFQTAEFSKIEHWKLSKSNDYILRSTHPWTDKTVWHIDSISSNTLILERYDDIKQKVIYTYKKTDNR